MPNYSISVIDRVDVDSRHRKSTDWDFTKDFYGKIVLSKAGTATSLLTKWRVLAKNITSNFWSEITLKRANLNANFWAELSLRKTVSRLYGIGSSAQSLTSYLKVVRNSYDDIINENLSINIDSLITSGTQCDFSITINSRGTARATLESCRIFLVEHVEDLEILGGGIREYFWSSSIKTENTGTFGRREISLETFDDYSNTFTESFTGLAEGTYVIFIEAIQKYTGNKYFAAREFTIGTPPYTISLGNLAQNVSVPGQISFSTNSSHLQYVRNIIWNFEPGVRQVFQNTAGGRSPTYTYNTIGTYIPVVTYVMKNGCKISRIFEGTYSE